MNNDLKKLATINNLTEYLESLYTLKNCLIIVAVCDNVGYWLDENIQSLLHKLGLEQDIKKAGMVGYIGIARNQSVIFEAKGNTNEPIFYEKILNSLHLSLESRPYHNGNCAKIIINGKDYAINKRGLNIVVWDLQADELVDSVAFDTHVPEIVCARSNEVFTLSKHYDVCLVGCWYGSNYGSLLNGYSVYNILKSMNLEVLMLNKHTAKPNDWEIYGTHNEKFIKTFYPAENVSPIIPFSQLKELNKYCDTFLAGSDQIWAYGINRLFDFAYMLNFVDDNKRKISFASSFGHEDDGTPPDKYEMVKGLLHRFNAIAVREQNGVKLCQDKYGIKATVALEPVFCVDKQVYYELEKYSDIQINEPYILTYILDPSPEKREAIQYYEHASGLKTFNILDGDPRVYEKNKNLLNLPNTLGKIGAEDFIKLFIHAEMVLTDSFHGTAFSVIFERKFLTINNLRRGTVRFTDILGRFNLLDRLVIDPKKIPHDVKYLQPVDFSEANQIIALERNKSIEWLKDSIFSPLEQLSSQKNIFNTVSTMQNSIKCTGCGSCANACPVEAISMIPNKDGFLEPTINYDKCINCQACINKCISLNPAYKNNATPTCYAMWAEDDIRKISSSGGFFTVAAEYILDNGGYVVGAAYTENYSVEHTIISTQSELDKLRGSKYMQSNLGFVYKEVAKLLDNNKTVLFTGLPCQVAGLYSFLNKEYETLYTIDLVCHGITSQKVFNKYRKDVLKDKKLIDLHFKAKEPWGWHAGMNAKFEDGTSYSVSLEKDPYFIAYLGNIAKNTTCAECQFNKLPRQADITMGDFWGINNFNPALNDGKGTSVILVNNNHANNLLNKLSPKTKMLESVPLNYALEGNRVMIEPYKLNRNREYFFKNLNNINFSELADMCRKNDFRKADEKALSELDPNLHGLYYLAKAVMQNYRRRKIVTWGVGPVFRKVLKDNFGLTPEFSVFKQQQFINGTTQKSVDILRGKSSEYYVVCLDNSYNIDTEQMFESFGYSAEEDYIYRIPKPIILENYNLAQGNYEDIYGNRITGTTGIIKKVIFHGLNNQIHLGKNIKFSGNVSFNLVTNTIVEIGDKCNFQSDVEFELIGINNAVRASIRIGNNCRFQNAKFRLFTDTHNSSILINDSCTFEGNFDARANTGQKIIIGNDCMFSYDIIILSGDGHSIFDVKSGKNINSDQNTLSTYKQNLVIGNHVWVGRRSFILAGTNVGDGSIIGAQSMVKGIFPNNCTIAGSPGKIVKRDIAWSRTTAAQTIKQCGKKEYIALTSDAKPSITGQKILVIGGTKFMGIKLVERLIALGNDVTIATRGNAHDSFGSKVRRIKLDVSDSQSVKKALHEKYYDIVFDNLAYCSNYVKNILSNVKCERYIQLSSVETYYPARGWIHEENFNPYTLPQQWNNTNAGYVAGKRQAEAAVYQVFKDISAVTVRIPYVTKTDRIFFFCKNVIEEIPMAITNEQRGLTFIRDEEVGRFLPWIAAQDFNGPINLSSTGFVTIAQILRHIEIKTGKKAIIDIENGKEVPFSVFKEDTFAMDMSKAEKLGWNSSDIDDWFWEMLDEYIARAQREAVSK